MIAAMSTITYLFLCQEDKELIVDVNSSKQSQAGLNK